MGEANAPVPLCLRTGENYIDDWFFILKQIYEAIYDGFLYHHRKNRKCFLVNLVKYFEDLQFISTVLLMAVGMEDYLLLVSGCGIVSYPH